MAHLLTLVRSGVGWREVTLAASLVSAVLIGCGKSGGSASAHPGSGADAGAGGKAAATAGANAAGTDNSAGETGGGKSDRGGTTGAAGSKAHAGAGGTGGSGEGGASGQGGRVAVAGAGGEAGAESAGAAGSPDDCQVADVTASGTRARSSGFSGTLEEYGTLYNLPCNTGMDCGKECLAIGGTEAMCEANYCQLSTPNYCLPATIWTHLDAVYTEGTKALTDGAELVVWPDPYRDFLLVDTFRLNVPEGAEILGITATIRRAGGGPDEVADDGVYLLKDGVFGSSDRSHASAWSGPDLTNVDYGGTDDLWGETWTFANVNADGFGVALTAAYPGDMGNGRAYVDIVYVKVSYRTCP